MTEYRIPVLNNFVWQPPVLDKDLTAPPEDPAKGDRYIVGSVATGDWEGEDGNIALYTGTEWDFTTATKSMTTYVEDEDKYYSFTTEWVLFQSLFGELDPAFTAWLATNPLDDFITEETDPLSLHLDQTEPQTIINGVPLMTTAVDEYGSGNQLVNKDYVDSGAWLMPPIIEWYDPVAEEGLPEDPEIGDRYGADSTGYGWTVDYIYEWDGDEWVESEPEEGWMLWCLLDLLFYIFFSGGWMEDGAYTYVPYTGALYDVDLGDKNFFTTGTLGAGAITGTSFVVGAYSLSTEFQYLDGIGAYVYRSGGTDVAVADGGTNLSSYAVGDLLYASAATTLSKLADVAAGSYLRSGGVNTAPLWSTLILPNAITANYVVYGSATNTYGSDIDLQFDGTNLGLGNAPVTNQKFTILSTGAKNGSGVSTIGLKITESSTNSNSNAGEKIILQLNGSGTWGDLVGDVIGLDMPTITGGVRNFSARFGNDVLFSAGTAGVVPYVSGFKSLIMSGDGMTYKAFGGDGMTLTVKQPQSSATVPVLNLIQEDWNGSWGYPTPGGELIRFEGHSYADNINDTIVAVGDVGSATVAGYGRVYVVDKDGNITSQAYYIPFYTLALP